MHDPRQFVEDFRNHLAAHERRLNFLFGAGTSCAVNVSADPRNHVPVIPGVIEMTNACEKAVVALGNDEKNAWTLLKGQCTGGDGDCNVEVLLTALRTKIDAIGSDETLLGLNRDKLSTIEKTVCATIAELATPDLKTVPVDNPHDKFANWIRNSQRTSPIEIFTTNYDVLFEHALERARVALYDGFAGSHQPFFLSESLDSEELIPGHRWVRLWKLHGSVNWSLSNSTTGTTIVRGIVSNKGQVILPSNRKYDESRKQPYMSFMDRLSRLVANDHSLTIVCGYSFSDEHINERLFSALDARNTSNLIAFQFDQLDKASFLSNAAIRRKNLTVIAPNAAIISGVHGEWQLSQPVDRKTHAFMDLAFDSRAVPPDDDTGAASASSVDLFGTMRLGDFNWFCRFLSSMGAQ